MILNDTLMSLKKGSLSLDEYLKKFKSLYDSLTAIKKPIDDTRKVFQLARAISRNKETCHTMTKPLSTKEDDDGVAVEADSRTNNSDGNNFGWRNNSNWKQTPNHQQGESTMTCQICGKFNHTALECWNRFDHSYQPEDHLPKALAAMNLKNKDDPNLYADSGATTHILNDPGKLSKVMRYKGNDTILVGNGESLNISHIGEGKIETKDGTLDLKNVLIVPNIKKNLISVGQLASDNACTIEFNANNFFVKSQQGKIIAKGRKNGGLYALDETKHQALAVFKNQASQSIWHKRMGHPHSKFLKVLHSKNLIDVSSWEKEKSVCISCQMGKNCKIPFTLSNNISRFPLDKLHCDLWGPAPILSCQQFKYYAIIVDDCTRYSWLFPLKKKRCFSYLRDYGKNKFAKKTYPCIFLGYSPIHKGYRCLDSSTNKVWISRHVVFDENVFPYAPHKETILQENLEVTTFPDLDAWRKKEIDLTIQKGNSQQSKKIQETDAQIQKEKPYIFCNENNNTKSQENNEPPQLSDTELENILPDVTVETENTALSPSENEEILTSSNESNSPSNRVSASDDNHSQTPEHQFFHDLPNLSDKLTIDLNDSGAGNNEESIQVLINQLSSEFALKDLGELHYFLGLEIADIFTKPLSKLPFRRFRDKLGVHSTISSSLKKDERNDQLSTTHLASQPSTTASDSDMEISNYLVSNLAECAAISQGFHQNSFSPLTAPQLSLNR
ncbi:hypothetical protein EZV62_010950 [Acer yangbiense]|uniref:GAG-pre-integrase domain-containing protein n=1 Tax=Acer yangbiense TaxID=1000413 RepID=A0A5C7I5Y2_9ROSI|nr:hypothetical protein EZV62_010950 [Acer yangbiense]